MAKSRVIAVIPTDLQATRLGLPSLLAHRVAGASVLWHTVSRVARVEAVARIVLVHSQGQDPRSLLDGPTIKKPVETLVDPGNLTDPYHAMRTAARKWSLTAWRGGLGGATCYDELLPAGPLVAAVQKYKADAALLVGGDWLLVDPVYCQRVLELHLENPQAWQMTFTQAPPGLAGVAVGRELLEDMAQSHATFGRMLAYNPTKPQGDPIGRDVCVQIEPAVRSCAERFIYDTPTSAAMIDWLVSQLGDPFSAADASQVVATRRQLDLDTADTLAQLPQQVTIELTPQRRLTGPLLPQHYVPIDRPDMAVDTAMSLVRQLGKGRDVALRLGGLGDALLYEHWDRVVRAAHDAGVLGIAVETDLIVDEPVLQRLLELPIDVVSVRLNADTAKTYTDVTGGTTEDFSLAINNLQWLLSQRNRRVAVALEGGESDPWVTTADINQASTVLATEAGQAPRKWTGDSDRQATTTATTMRQELGAAVEPSDTENLKSDYPGAGAGNPRAGVPWVVTRLVKTNDTLRDMETFYDRWVHFAGHAVIEPATTGCGLMPILSPVNMAPPRRVACRQLSKRMTILSDGRVALCDQDWLGRACSGDATQTPLTEIWRSMLSMRKAHEEGKWTGLSLCGSCHEWHRP